MQKPISITAVASISPLGKTLNETWESYQNDTHCITEMSLKKGSALVSKIPTEAQETIETLRLSDSKYKTLDRTVLYAIYASRLAIQQAGWKSSDNFGINIGSSRGATHLFETYYDDYLKNDKTKTLSSPTTTLGNISSWIAHDLQTKGPEISHSITCSTALHAVLNGIAWIQSGMCDKFLVGGSEAPLTPFTIAQMQALKIYAKNNSSYPCKALDLSKKQNTMVLGEGASVTCLEMGKHPNTLATIEGIGFATEILEHNISISSDAKCFQKSMRMALENINPETVDAIVMHAPGTIKGDLSELKAIQEVFKDKVPAVTSNKWKIGHTFGASGALSLELAILMLQHQKFIGVPYIKNKKAPKQIKTVLVNAVGFGGNAVSILLKQ
ncbi:beta-ketoacyl-[acyl-carrier-protein] synthase family protein [Snuella lapsa]|uniref:Beta-ketoacyl synthase N-terminal-like domain-containing protein n=1 Tax=Snuella lapsa TaxID=870481 RepID=A0ABP6XHB1_9FLAO